MICDNCKVAEHFIKKGRAEVIDELQAHLERRLHWDNDIYKLAIKHTLELLAVMRCKPCE